MKKIVTFGEIMLRLAPSGFQRFTQARSFEAIYGGGEANVAVSLANYGEEVEFVTRLPKNDLGEACLMSLRGYGIHTEHIARGGDRIGIYFLEKGAAQRGSKVIYDRANSYPNRDDRLEGSFRRRGLVPLDRHHTCRFARRGGSLP